MKFFSAFCHFWNLIKKKFRAFDGELSARLPTLPSTYVDNSLFWEERNFPKDKFFFRNISRLRAENVFSFSELFAALMSKLQLAYPEDHSVTFSELSLDFEHLRDMSSNCWEFLLKNFSTVNSKLHSSCTDEHFEQKLLFEFFSAFCHFWNLIKKKFRAFDGELSARLPTLPSTYVDNSLFWEERNFPKDKFFFRNISRLRAENVFSFSELFAALMSKLQLAYPEDHSVTFSELSLDFEHLRDMSSNCWEFLLKNFSTVNSKLHSSCTDEHFEQKLLFEFFFSFLSLLELNQKKIGLLTENFWHGCPHALLRM